MREAIGGTWLFGLVITFIVFFASFLAVSINYAKAFNVKNNIVDLISKYEGNNCKARANIKSYLKTTGYLVTGSCPTNSTAEATTYDYKAYDLDGKETSMDKAYYCVAMESSGDSTTIERNYYRVVIFFRLDLPVFGDLTTFRIKGETESIFFPKDEADSLCTVAGG